MSRKPAVVAVGAALWLASGVWAAGNMNAALRHDFARLYQSAEESRRYSMIEPVFYGPMVAAVTLLADGIRSDWTLTTEPLPCTEKTEIGRRIWCGREI